MRFARPLVLSVTLAALALSGCGGDDDPPAGAAAPDADTVAVGEQVYAASCASCHGADFEGTDRGPSHLSIVYEPGHHPDDAFRSAIANGSPQHHWDFGPMPPVEGLTEDEVVAVIAYIRSEQERRGFEE